MEADLSSQTVQLKLVYSLENDVYINSSDTNMRTLLYSKLFLLFISFSISFAQDSWQVPVRIECENLVQEINFNSDWWYIDDLAEFYCRKSGYQNLYNLHNGERIFTPEPNDDGQKTVNWFANILGRSK